MTESILEILRRDHARLRGVLERVDAFLLRRARALATRGTLAAITTEPSAGARALALEFAAHLGTHLAAEPDTEEVLGGLLDGDVGSTGALGALHGEHVELRSMLTDLVRTVDGPASARSDEQIAVQLRDLVDLVRIHARKEDVLVLAASQSAAQPPRRRKGNPS